MLFLDGGLVWDWSYRLWLVVSDNDKSGSAWLDSLALEEDRLSGLLGLTLLSSVVLDTLDEGLTALGVTDVLNTDVDTLLEVTVSDWLVDDYAEGGLCDVVDNAGLSVVPLVWETMKFPLSAPNSFPALSGFRSSYPFWTAALATISTISPTWYWVR